MRKTVTWPRFTLKKQRSILNWFAPPFLPPNKRKENKRQLEKERAGGGKREEGNKRRKAQNQGSVERGKKRRVSPSSRMFLFPQHAAIVASLHGIASSSCFLSVCVLLLLLSRVLAFFLIAFWALLWSDTPLRTPHSPQPLRSVCRILPIILETATGRAVVTSFDKTTAQRKFVLAQTFSSPFVWAECVRGEGERV